MLKSIIKNTGDNIKIRLGVILLCLLAISVQGAHAIDISTDIDLQGMFRSDNFDWSISGDINGANPNILSELKWTDLKINGLKLSAVSLVEKSYYLRSSVNYGWITSGKNRDSDYFGDNRTFEFSRSDNKTDDGYVKELSMGLGYQFKDASGSTMLAPMVGYSYHMQKLKITDGFQSIPLNGPFPGLNSTYESIWKGPWIGFDVSYIGSDKITFSGVFEYHWIDFNAEADWNLRSDFAHPKSFAQDADGNGISFSLGMDYLLKNNWSVVSGLNFRDWSTNFGVDRTYFVDGTTIATGLNEVSWHVFSFSMGVRY